MNTFRYSSPPLASRHQKGKRRSSVKGRSLVVVIIFVFLILAVKSFIFIIGGSLHSRKLKSGNSMQMKISRLGIRLNIP
jgi:hypothetical protein